MWGLYKNTSNQWVTSLIKTTSYNISSFGQDENGELYIVDYGGQLIRIDRSPIITATFTSSGSVDGNIVETSETSGLGGSKNDTSNLLMVGDTSQDQQIRSILSFNTSGLPDTAVITSAKLQIKKFSLTGADPFASLGKLVADIGTPTFGSSAILQSGDFQAGAGANSCAIFSTTPVANWYSAGITPAGQAKISLTKNTQFRLRFTKDDNDNHLNNRVNFFSGNASGNQPELTVTYYIP